MRKSKILVIIMIVCMLLILAVAIGLFCWSGGTYQYAELEGYGIMVLDDWQVKEEENELCFNHGETEKGRFTLLYQDMDLSSIPEHFGFTGAEPVIRESDQYAVKVYELSYQAEGVEVLQYVLDALPDAPPYKAVLTLYGVQPKVARRMLAGFSLPELPENAPAKPREAMTTEELSENVYVVENEFGIFSYNIGKLEEIIAKQSEQPRETAALHILSYGTDENGRELRKWYYLLADSETTWLFTYEQAENGQYVYDNNPQRITKLSRTASAEENYTRYLADGLQLLETPYNQYTENRDKLLSYKGTFVGDNSSVHGLIMDSLPVGVLVEELSLQTDAEPYGMTVRYTLAEPERYIKDGVLDESAFYQNALLLFSLIQNVDSVTMEITYEDQAFTVQYNRQAAEKQMENQDLRGFAEDAKEFEHFTEELPKYTPPTEESSGNASDGTHVVCSRTVTVSGSTKVQHPKTGKMVAIGPYAEKYGVSQYLNKPITVTLYEKVEEGKTTMWAEGTCNGVSLGTYPISSRAEFDSLIGMAG